LGKYSARFPEEKRVCRQLEEFVTNHQQCFERELLTGHVTGSAWVVDGGFTKTLLTHHKKLDKWFQPGGHADGDSDVASVAMREAVEETGLAGLEFVSHEIFDLDIHLIPDRKDEPQHYHYDCRFIIRCTGNEAYTVTTESNDLAWIPFPEIGRYTNEESILRMVEKVSVFADGHPDLI